LFCQFANRTDAVSRRRRTTESGLDGHETRPRRALAVAAVFVVGPTPLVLLSAIVGVLVGTSCYFVHRVLSDRVGGD
jgi:hypothetical protein